MASPLAVGSLTTFPQGAGAGGDRLTSLPSATAYGLGSVNQSAAMQYDNNVAPIRIKTGASGTSATGYCRLWLVTSEDGTVWTDGVDPTVATNQAAKLVTAPLITGIATVANATTYYFPEFTVMSVLGFQPLYWAVVVENQAGSALDTVAASFYSRYLPIGYA
jgi:hypothetical protein